MFVFARREFHCRFPSVRKAIKQMRPRAICFVHGEKDSYLPVEQSRRLYALAGQPKYLWVAPGARHNQAVILNPEEYAARLLRFFDRFLAQRTGQPAPAAASPVAAS
jgi:pimeloyl-ACP methyl ester carboxylesterase